MDDGRLTDGQGRVVNFKNAVSLANGLRPRSMKLMMSWNQVIILTSNVGSQILLDGMQNGVPQREVRDASYTVMLWIGLEIDSTVVLLQSQKQALQLIKQTFPPEFLNRIDEVALFEPLTIDKMSKILKVAAHLATA